MFDHTDPLRPARRDAVATAHADRPATPPDPVTPVDPAFEVDADWPDPVELAVGLEVQYLADEARTTHFGDLDPAVEPGR